MKNSEAWAKARELGWDKVLKEVLPELKDAIDAREQYAHGPQVKVTCPVHGTSSSSGRGKNFSMYSNMSDTGGAVCNSCGSFSHGNQVMAWVLQARDEPEKKIISRSDLKKEYMDKANTLLISYLEGKDISIPDARQQADKERAVVAKDNDSPMALWQRRNEGEAMWKRSHEFHDWVRGYFQQRGNPNPELTSYMRLAQDVPYWMGFRVKYFPAMLLPIVQGDSSQADKVKEVIGVHRIYLDVQDFKISKAPVDEPKKMLRWGDLKGAYIPLYPLGDSKVMVACEGPETGVALRTMSGLPVRSGINKWGLENIMIPDQVEHLIIGVDHDVSGAGMESANILKQRAEALGKKCTLMTPDMFPIPKGAKGLDWDDALKLHPEKCMSLWSQFRNPNPEVAFGMG